MSHARPWELVSPKACERMDCSDRDHWQDTRHCSDDDEEDDEPLSQRSDQSSSSSSLQVFPTSCTNGIRKQRSSSSADTTLLSQFEETPRNGQPLSLDGGLLSPLPESALANFSPQSIPENAVLSPQATSAVHFAQRERALRQRTGSSNNNNNNTTGSSTHSGWRLLSFPKSPLQHLSHLPTASVLRSFRRRCSRSTTTSGS
ncbi:hypothetical protein PINS_up019753 [Pythium insidiosum]|nr:hypothetical protein PINS_up019753 [Pythium insidiosum]